MATELEKAKKYIADHKDKPRNKQQETKYQAALETRREAPRGADAPSSVKAAKPKEATFAGTNIPLSAIKDLDQREEFQRRLAADIADGNDRGANDVIFGIAYAAGGNKGQGNPNVGAVQSGVWRLDDGDLWAETAINSDNDVYRIRNDDGELTGQRVEFSDQHGVLSGKADSNTLEPGLLGADDAIDSWGQNPRAQIQGGQPTFKPSTGTQSIWTSYGDDPGWQAYFTSDPSLGSAKIQTPKPDGPTTTGAAGTGTGTGTGSMDLLPYRTGTSDYWKKYISPKMTDSLMQFKLPTAKTGGLSYLPGEVRDPGQWANFLGMGGRAVNPRTLAVTESKRRALDNQFQGFIPQGTWRRSAENYPGKPGWDFTAPRTNLSQMVAQTPWTPQNLAPAAATQWTGLLGDWAAPAINTTNLLGVA
jgi:hypothetical protein